MDHNNQANGMKHPATMGTTGIRTRVPEVWANQLIPGGGVWFFFLKKMFVPQSYEKKVGFVLWHTKKFISAKNTLFLMKY